MGHALKYWDGLVYCKNTIMGLFSNKGHCLKAYLQQQWNKKAHYFSGCKLSYCCFCISLAGSALDSAKRIAQVLVFFCIPNLMKIIILCSD